MALYILVDETKAVPLERGIWGLSVHFELERTTVEVMHSVCLSVDLVD